jgi:hypothetical protein
VREIARRLIALETRTGEPLEKRADAALRAFEKLRLHLSKLVGNVGFQALLTRALMLSKAEVRWLEYVQVKEDGTLEGFSEIVQQQDADVVGSGMTALLGQMLGLLVTFIGEGLTDRMDGEGGDDIMVGNGGEGDRYEGFSGFDWAVFKDAPTGATVDLTLRAFDETPVPPSAQSILARFTSVEGLSGSAHGDFLRGDDADAAAIAVSGAYGSVLENIALIDGLQEVLDGLLGGPVTSFGAGNIILGGDGSDIIEGRGGDDLIDGDKWLNVRISVRANPDGTGPEIASFDSMEPLIQHMLSGEWNPGQLQIVREILPGSGGFSFDTAVFSGNAADYTILTDNGGTPLDFNDDIVRVVDNVADRDGADRLVNVERLQFADQSITLVPGLNAEPVGLLTIDNPTPTEGELLHVSIADVTDADNVNPTNPTGAVTGSVSYVWQVERNPATGVFEDIVDLRGDLAFQSANGTAFRVTPDLSGLSLRVKAVYIDANGVPETVFSAPTTPVIDVADAPPAAPAALVPDITEGGPGIHLIRTDLDFILQQIKIAEAHAAGEDLLSLVPNVRAPAGLRTVSGEFNNLVDFGGAQQTQFGAADNLFPRLLDPMFRNDQDGDSISFGPPPAPTVTNTNFGVPGDVVDADPRIISNLIVDQTAHNPRGLCDRL